MSTAMQKEINKILSGYPNSGQENLIPILQDIQQGIGYLSEEAVIKVGEHLGLPVSKIFSVATFYNQFRFEPKGKYHIMVCRGTACHVLGSSTVLKEIEKKLKIKEGQTTRDGLFSIEIVACIGACGLAPVININGQFFAKVTTDSLTEIIESFRNKEKES
ncbi:MAG TPA: NADH-quinone oxidoreductase subunit NuoE [Bacteroidales bacterium]|nr:NADH-quinone oxidoreductase subunit NuoE [Bacteroidales bacterium]HPS18088.1 NADH-quinone oxidoreductase subunit NuoE [Bacteroidales bacterium]